MLPCLQVPATLLKCAVSAHSKQLTHFSSLQELQAAHLQVMEVYAEGRSVQELADLSQQPMPVVEAWLQVGPQYFA